MHCHIFLAIVNPHMKTTPYYCGFLTVSRSAFLQAAQWGCFWHGSTGVFVAVQRGPVLLVLLLTAALVATTVITAKSAFG